MACWWLRRRPDRVRRVAMPTTADRPYVAVRSPAELADLFSSGQELADAERTDFTEDFLRLRREAGLLRQQGHNDPRRRCGPAEVDHPSGASGEGEPSAPRPYAERNDAMAALGPFKSKLP